MPVTTLETTRVRSAWTTAQLCALAALGAVLTAIFAHYEGASPAEAWQLAARYTARFSFLLFLPYFSRAPGIPSLRVCSPGLCCDVDAPSVSPVRRPTPCIWQRLRRFSRSRGHDLIPSRSSWEAVPILRSTPWPQLRPMLRFAVSAATGGDFTPSAFTICGSCSQSPMDCARSSEVRAMPPSLPPPFLRLDCGSWRGDRAHGGKSRSQPQHADENPSA